MSPDGERPNVPYRVRTVRCWLRCWHPRDARTLLEALADSREAMRRWIPWAEAEPLPRSAKVQYLRDRRAAFDRDEEYLYGIFDGERLLGGAGLHRRVGPDALEVGYWTRSGHTGQGPATEAAAALVRIAFEVHGVERVDLRCDPANEASARIARKLGFEEEALLRRRYRMADGALRDTLIFSLHRERYPGSPAAAADLELYDAEDERIYL